MPLPPPPILTPARPCVPPAGVQLINGSFFAVSAFFYLSGFLAVTFAAKVLSAMTKRR